MISPNNKIKKVTTTTSKAKRIQPMVIWWKMYLPTEANKITMAILMKLLATSMVANSFFGRSNSREMIWKAVDFSSKPLSISERVKEKKATSAPEIRAEHTSRATMRMIPTINSKFSED